MISGVLASASPPTFTSSSLVSKPKTSCFSYASSSVTVAKVGSSDLKLQRFGLYGRQGSRRDSRVHCNIGPGGPVFGEGDSKSVLDAFFVGRALAEAINERIESSVGEFLSTIGRLQAEQQKQVEEFQADVLERAKKAKEKAAREAAEAQGIVSKSTTESTKPITITNGSSPATPATTTSTVVTPVSQPSVSDPTPTITENEPVAEDTSSEENAVPSSQADGSPHDMVEGDDQSMAVKKERKTMSHYFMLALSSLLTLVLIVGMRHRSLRLLPKMLLRR